MQKLSLRQQTIIDMIGHQEYCSIDELAQHFNVTTQTIRRDINQLCAIGLACRHHGGVGLPVTLANRSYVSRKVTNQAEKQHIAASVVAAIPNGCTLFLGIGTTIAGIAEKLVNHSELRVVTNNFEAAHLLSQFDNIETWIPGGRIRSNDRDVVGDSIGAFYGQFIADIGIISCGSINPIEKPVALNSLAVQSEGEMQEYAFEYELREAIVSQAIISGSRQKWLVANSAKRQQKANAKVAPLSHFDRVFGGVTDKN
ncbi:transcriptional regulator for glycerol-3-phosphate regulon, DeoR family protein [Psychromonas ingrahamii 37]|uniref:Transcriptional regulator for glycerol-3-phosphate regulon, DeoR family protein n=1 Tax=Psychromonas ingrahamii (strain DSM 17664 / CCUG 51855 / 37) TaxID=357804 RepID=A1SWH4_PSYIN|nr:DeoR/GlpR family DNA-binding transcription regulator [Psychromonas ingrahamii]ABM03839.1 transcriptional regulator for glycerol-3-phosphate regulon, DeoR family protein [Psychromonas ingrahamii 37]